MNAITDTLLAEAKKLTAEERIKLAEDILATVHAEPAPDIDAAWTEVVQERMAEHERGEAEMIPAADVFAKYRSS